MINNLKLQLPPEEQTPKRQSSFGKATSVLK